MMVRRGALRLTMADSAITADFGRNRLLQLLTGIYALVWTAAAIAPVYRFDWFLENLLVLLAVGLLAASYRSFPLSNLSYLLITLFLSLHTLGAHFTYSQTPFGFWLQEIFGLARNPYDRLVHFGFGLIVVYPVREALMRSLEARGLRADLLAFAVMLASSSLYEMIEWTTALIISPEAALAFLGTQGDVFDAQKDTLAAAAGALLGLGMRSLGARLAARALDG
jgi:putative membrane protein